ncbi:phage tail protein [Photorhabdus khanii]|uniref:Phage tail collar domain-containing protein n=1 Tax=Photorhabdus khanii subsp. guanajuatensis TaxID=2100166 RepID=A0A4R4K0G9_9GAMM|nr:phage tail protein [Photorhabdus khanii]TDB60734.1 hypothetical protein C5467_06595 [Photorhabdus khanii subsp. guanajuatensis]
MTDVIPVGVPLPWPTDIPPTGWVKCNGAVFDESLYPKLSEAYPDGKLPDLHGEFIRGWDNGRGVDVGRYLLFNQFAYISPHNQRIIRMWSNSNTTVADGLRTPSYILNSVTKDANYGFDGRGLGITTGIGNGGFGYMDDAILASTGIETRPRNVAFNYIVRIV